MVWLFLSVLLIVVVYLAIQFPAFRAMLFIVMVAGAGGLYYIKVENDKSKVEYDKRMELSRRLNAEREEQQRILDAEAERRRQQALAEQQRRTQQAALELAQRRKTAGQYIDVVSASIECPFSSSFSRCGTYSFTVGLRNRSRETISRVFVGWVFLPQGQSGCPTSYPTKYQKAVTLRPGDTTVLNIDSMWDGPAGAFRYCVRLTDIDIIP